MSPNKPTIFICGQAFVPTKSGLVNSLFKPIAGRTACGTYRVKGNAVILYDLQDAPFAAVINERGMGIAFFFVTCSNDAGKIRYMFGLRDTDAKYLNLPGSLIAQHEAAKAAYDSAKNIV